MNRVTENKRDIPVVLDSVPMPAHVRNQPYVVADERRVLLLYRIADGGFDRFGRGGDDGDPFCVVRFRGPCRLQFRVSEQGQHVPAAKGLRCPWACEVLKSSLMAALPPRVAPKSALRHFIFTFECVAQGCELLRVYGSGDELLDKRSRFSVDSRCAVQTRKLSCCGC